MAWASVVPPAWAASAMYLPTMYLSRSTRNRASSAPASERGTEAAVRTSVRHESTPASSPGASCETPSTAVTAAPICALDGVAPSVYLHFPDRFALLLATPLAEDIRPGTAIVQAMQSVITRCVDAGVVRAMDPYCATLCLWTSLHGLISMMAAQPHVPWPPREDLVNTLLSTYIVAD